MLWTRRLTFYQKILFSLLGFLLLPILAGLIISYWTIKQTVTDKINLSNKQFIELVAKDITKTTDEVVNNSNFLLHDAELLKELSVLKEASTIQTYATYKAMNNISEYFTLLTTRTMHLSTSVSIMNPKGLLLYGIQSEQLYADLRKELSRLPASEGVDASRVYWLGYPKGAETPSRETAPSYYVSRVMKNRSTGELLGTLYYGLPYGYFDQLLGHQVSGTFHLTDAGGAVIYPLGGGAFPNQAGEGTISQSYVLPETGWTLTYTISTGTVTGEVKRTFLFYAALVLLAGMVLMLAAVVYARGLYRPIFQMKSIVNLFSGGNQSVRFPVEGNDEIAQLGYAFNSMLTQISGFIHDIRQEQEDKRVLELQALTAQIRPHFLMNTLNSIKCNLLLTGDTIHSRQLDALMRLLWANMNIRELTTLSEECTLLTHYIQIMQMRSGLEVQLVLALDEASADWQVPRLLLQPLVENALIHGFGGTVDLQEDPEIRVTSTVEDGQWVVQVADNGAGMTGDVLDSLNTRLTGREEVPGSRHIGLVNTYQRLRLAYGAAVNMTVIPGVGIGLIVELRIPLSGDTPHLRHVKREEAPL
ncbi:sensor histidine kinase [Paenibacillus roseipurpureus]|uniref:Histidine kinase n=1 Tax=Paenibacillus roseopurpureus TaxID=2918901 RepID=A0AA96RJB8_9BACL|nr:histidine kinase [Paenibacillus sp. MBLB1832]WNR42996.1 histidine kinase [Paenibacillus sp. MBLB1832]